MTKQEIAKIVNDQLMLQEFPNIDGPDANRPLKEFIAMDSLDWVEFMVGIEKRFGISLTDDVMYQLQKQSFEEIVQHILDRKSLAIA